MNRFVRLGGRRSKVLMCVMVCAIVRSSATPVGATKINSPAKKQTSSVVARIPPPYAGGQSPSETGSLLPGLSQPPKVGESQSDQATTKSKQPFTAPITKPPSPKKPKVVQAKCKGTACDAGRRRVTRPPKGNGPVEAITVYPVEPETFDFGVSAGDPIADSSGECEGVDSKWLAQQTRLAFYVAELGGWCELRGRDGSIIARVDHATHPEWALLQPNDYWRDYLSGLGRSALFHQSDGPQSYSGVNVFIDGGRTFEVHVLRGGVVEAVRIARLMAPKITLPDSQQVSYGACGRIDAKALAAKLKLAVVVPSDQAQVDSGYCWMNIDNYRSHLFIGKEPVTEDDTLSPNAYFTELIPGLGRVAVYHAPGSTQQGSGSYHVFEVLQGALDIVLLIDAPDRDSAKSVASSILNSVVTV